MKIISTSINNCSVLVKYFLALVLSLLAFASNAQVDSTFWFAVPFVGGHGNGNSELVIANMSKTLSNTITLTNPGNPLTGGMPPAGLTFTIPPGQSTRINLNQYYGAPQSAGGPGSLYANAPNVITRNGLKITSTTAITAYYEQGRGNNNVDIFALKGSNALGRDFMLPFQNHYATWNNQDSYSSADIVATENDTRVTITPTRAAVGRAANIPFTIILQMGQTYSLRALGLNAVDHMSGSRVSSDKPIAITLVDDSMDTGQDATWPEAGGIDMAGDQIVPLNVIGKEYIVARGNAGPSGDKNRIFILTTQPNTNITISENGSIARTLTNLNAALTTNYLQPNTSPATYIKSDKPIYVFYITGTGSELGGALIPSILCTGSDAVSLVRSSDAAFTLTIVAKTKIINNFRINGTTGALLGAGDFTVVTTVPVGEGFSVAQRTFTTAQFPSFDPANPTTFQISNDFPAGGYFHVGISNEDGNSSRFGYFSDFSSINISYANKPVCFGDSLVLDAGPNRDSYKWYTKPTLTTENVLSIEQVFKVKDPGRQKIYLRIEKRNCPLEDSVDVFIQPKVDLKVLKKKIECANQPVSMDATPAITFPPLVMTKYRWYTSSQTIPVKVNDTIGITSSISPQFEVGNHIVYIDVTDINGCKFKDTVDILIKPAPAVSLASFLDSKVCSGDSVQLGIASPNINYVYKWRENGLVPPAQIKATGLSDTIKSNPKASKVNLTLLPINHTYYINTLDTSTSCLKVDDLVLTINPIPKAQIDLTKSKFCKTDNPEIFVGSAPGFTGGTYNFYVDYVDANSPTVAQFDPSTASTTVASKIKLKYVSAAPASCPAPDVDSLVTVSDKPTIAMTAASYCSGQSVTIGVAKDMLYKYAWTQDLDLAISKLDTHQALIAVKNITASPITKNYALTVTSKTNVTCTNSGSVDVVINPQPMASFTTVDPLGIKAIGYCVNSADVPFTGTPTGGSFSSSNTSMVGSTFSPKFIGSNLVKYTVTTFTCTDDTIIDVTVNKLPEPLISGVAKLTYCVGDPTLVITGNAVSPEVGTFAVGQTPGPGGNFPLTTAGTFVFKYDITDSKGCTASTDTSLEIKGLPTLNVTPATPAICLGETATLVASGGDSYIWTGLSSSVGTVIVKPIISSNYTVVAVNAANCKSASQAVTVTVNKTPVANFPDKNIFHCFEEGNVSLFAGLAANYAWSDGSVIDTLKVSDGGFYKVTLIEGICNSSDSVIVVAVCPPRVFLPKAFSPNNDGYNDSLQIFGDHFKDIKLRVFNRWGEVVFESTQKDKLWDGTYNGANMPAGVYPWVLNYKSQLAADKNKIFSVDGSVSIIK